MSRQLGLPVSAPTQAEHALSELLLEIVGAREGHSPGRGMSNLELARQTGRNVVVVARALHELFFAGRLVLLHGGPTVVEVIR